jgi:hypothetical protein
MWRELIETLNDQSADPDPTLEFFAPTSFDQVRYAEQMLDTAFPEELTQLLLETNGIQLAYGMGFVWSIDEIIQSNLAKRRDNTAYEAALFFADAGNGDQYYYEVATGRSQSTNIHYWKHKTNDTLWVADSLRQYIEMGFNR